MGGSSTFPSLSTLALLELGMLEVEAGLTLSGWRMSSKDLRDCSDLGLFIEGISAVLSVLLNSLVSVMSPGQRDRERERFVSS